MTAGMIIAVRNVISLYQFSRIILIDTFLSFQIQLMERDRRTNVLPADKEVTVTNLLLYFDVQ